MKELVQLARSKPGQLNCAHSGPGTTAHLGCEMLKTQRPHRHRARVLQRHGSGRHRRDRAASRNSCSRSCRAGCRTSRRASFAPSRSPGRSVLRRFRTCRRSPKRVSAARTSSPGTACTCGPAPLDRSLRSSTRDFNRALKFPTSRSTWPASDSTRPRGTTEAFGAFVKEDIARWTKVIREANVRVEQ